MNELAQVAILIGAKGRGSNMRALIQSCMNGEVAAEVRVVVSPSSDSPGALAAESMGVAVATVVPGDNYGDRILKAVNGCDWICLAGFTRLLPINVVHAYEHRILNIHPALLPHYGGKGMYGRHVHEAVIEAGERESGCTVHWVSEAYDEGAIIHQETCPVFPADTAEMLAERVLALEHQAYPRALAKVINGL